MTNGRIRQSIVFWCFNTAGERWNLDRTCQVAREQGAARVVMAAPVGAPGSARSLLGACDQVICLYTPASFASVGEWYEDFAPIPDAAVAALLRPGPSG